MKYARLTKEQLDSLQQEFINFLATQTITAQEWQTIKKEQPQVAEQELDVFSDLVWEGALSQAKFLENISPKLLFLFKLEAQQMSLISCSATCGCSFLMVCHSWAVMVCVAKKLMNSCCKPSSCSLVSLAYFIL